MSPLKRNLLFLLSMLISAVLAVIACNFLELKSGGHWSVSIGITGTDELQQNMFSHLGMLFICVSLLLGFISIFLFHQPKLQLKLSYALLVLQLALTLIVSFCPVVNLEMVARYHPSPYAISVGVAGIITAWRLTAGIKNTIHKTGSPEDSAD